MGTHNSLSKTTPKQVLTDRALVRSKVRIELIYDDQLLIRCTLQVIWVLQLLTTLGPGFTRTSIMFLYRRIFVGRVTHINIWVFIAINIIWTIGFFFGNLRKWPPRPFPGRVLTVTLVGCLPIQGNWYPDPNGKCIDFIKFYKSMVVSDVILDGLVLIIPWYPVYRLQMGIRQKMTVLGIFLLGGFVVLSGIFRVIAMFDAMKPDPDRTYARAPAFYWATIEVGVGIVSACLPTMRPLISKSGPESILRSFSRKLSTSFSRTKLSQDYTMDNRSAASEAGIVSSVQSSRGEKTHIYDGPQASNFQQQTRIEAAENHHPYEAFDGIRVERNVHHNAQNRGL